jgi:hypothetical protein
VVAVGAFPDPIERVQGIVLVLFPPAIVNSNVPVKPLLELAGAV